jgi:hypothetical protein
MRFRAEDVRSHGWQPAQTFQIPDWCGCSIEYLPVPTGDGWWQLVQLVPILGAGSDGEPGPALRPPEPR